MKIPLSSVPHNTKHICVQSLIWMPKIERTLWICAVLIKYIRGSFIWVRYSSYVHDKWRQLSFINKVGFLSISFLLLLCLLLRKYKVGDVELNKSLVTVFSSCDKRRITLIKLPFLVNFLDGTPFWDNCRVFVVFITWRIGFLLNI